MLINCKIFETFSLIVHCKTRCITWLITDHLRSSQYFRVNTSGSPNILFKKRPELSESSAQTFVSVNEGAEIVSH